MLIIISYTIYQQKDEIVLPNNEGRCGKAGPNISLIASHSRGPNYPNYDESLDELPQLFLHLIKLKKENAMNRWSIALLYNAKLFVAGVIDTNIKKEPMHN